MRKRTGIICMAVGVIFLIAAAGLLFYNVDEEKRAASAAEYVLQNIKSEIENKASQSDSNIEKTLQIDGYDYIGYLSIPDLNLDIPVMSEWDYKRMETAPCLYYGSIEENNMVIAGHNYSKHFKYLSELKAGAKIYFTDPNGAVYTYEVGTLEILRPEQVEDMVQSGWNLSIYTCTYGGQTRLTVRCMRIYEE